MALATRDDTSSYGADHPEAGCSGKPEAADDRYPALRQAADLALKSFKLPNSCISSSSVDLISHPDGEAVTSYCPAALQATAFITVPLVQAYPPLPPMRAAVLVQTLSALQSLSMPHAAPSRLASTPSK